MYPTLLGDKLPMGGIGVWRTVAPGQLPQMETKRIVSLAVLFFNFLRDLFVSSFIVFVRLNLKSFSCSSAILECLRLAVGRWLISGDAILP